MIKFIYCALFIGLLTNCIDVSEEEVVNEKTKVESFTKVYIGTIDNERIVVELTSDAGELTGKYFCRSGGADLLLSGTLDTLGNIELTDSHPTGDASGIMTANLKNSNIIGTWTVFGGTEELPLKLYQSNVNYMAEQAKVIQENVNFSPIIAGTYRPIKKGANSSTLVISKLNGLEMYFTLFVKGNRCMDDVDGVVRIAKDGSGEIDIEDCRFLRFEFEDYSVRIIDDGPCAYHGSACGFEGEFMRL